MQDKKLDNKFTNIADSKNYREYLQPQDPKIDSE